MKNNKLLYLLTIIITLFTFNTRVNAAQELTCIYEMNTDITKKIILAQNGSGELKLFLNTKDVSINDNGWQDALELGYKINLDNITDGVTLDSNNKLSQCPSAYVRHSNDNTLYFLSPNEFRVNSTSLYGHSKEYQIPNIYKVTEENGTNEKCDNISKKQIISFDENNYIASCVYAQDTSNGCHIIQMDIKKNGDVDIVSSDPAKTQGFSTEFYPEFSTIGMDTLKETYDGWCPNEIFVNREQLMSVPTETEGAKILGYVTRVRLETIESNYNVYLKKEGYGKNLIDESLEQTNDQIKDIALIGNKIDILDCEALFTGASGEKLKDMLKFLVNLIKISIPVILIGIGVIDFARAIFAGKEDDMKKVQGKFIKRIIIAVCIYLVPTLLTLILEIASSIWPNISADFCGIL